MSAPESFFIPDGDRFIATELTRGPWSPVLQHGGPPAALMARAVERAAPGHEVARLAVEFLRPLPIAPLTVEARPIRAGKKVQFIGVTVTADGKERARATAVCVRRAALDLEPVRRAGMFTPPTPEACAPFEFPFFSDRVGYQTGMEIRIAGGAWGSGEMAAWMRLRAPLVAGEAPSPLMRVMAAADSGNGISVGLDLRRWTFVNPDLTVHLARPLEGEWVCLESSTVAEPTGVGLAATVLHDVRGPIGRSSQCLFIDAREGGTP
jgi:hypothetical protein